MVTQLDRESDGRDETEPRHAFPWGAHGGRPQAGSAAPPARRTAGAALSAWVRRGFRAVLASWAVRGYRQADAGHLVAIIAFNALVALLPTLLLLAAVAGLVLRDAGALIAAVQAILWALPATEARDAMEAALAARRHSGWIGALSLLGFAWIGTNFADALAHCLNRVHGVPDCGYVCTRRRGFAVVLGAAALFLLAALAAGLPTLFVGRDLGPYFATWALAGGRGQLLGYGVALAAAAALFGLLYRVLPNAGQRLGDVWPGALVAGALFVALGQAFPLYLRLVGGANRYGAALGLVSLLVSWFAALGHVLLFGAYVNATYRRRRDGSRGANPGDDGSDSGRRNGERGADAGT